MAEEIGGLYVSIGADLNGLMIGLEEAQILLQDFDLNLLGGLTDRLPQEFGQLLGGIQVALAPLPEVLNTSLYAPILASLSAVEGVVQEKIGAILSSLNALISQIHAAVGLLSVASPTPLGNLPARANGGAVIGGQAYLVGERGAEIFVAGSSGQIIPNHALRGGADGGNVVINGAITIHGVQDVESLYDQLRRVSQQRG